MDAFSDFLSQYRPERGAAPLPAALAGRYDILSCLKHQGDRQVLLLRDRESRAMRILKIAPVRQKALMQRELALLTRLHDPAFPHPVLCFTDEARAYLLREYVPGRSLAEIVEDNGPLPEGQAAALARKVCRIVGRLHECTPPVIHRDIKPQNVILSPDGSMHLVDLDAAEDVRPERSADTVVMGTAATAAPEQFGFQRCDERTDIYAIGMLLTYLLIGEYALSALKGAAVSKPLKRVAANCLRFDPRGRIRSVEHLEKRLEAPGRLNCRRIAAGVCAALALLIIGGLCLGAPRIAAFLERANALAAEPAYAFASPLVERAVRLQLDRPRGRITRRDLRFVTELDLCGETPFARWEDLDSRGRALSIGGAPFDGRAVLDDASDFSSMPNLRRLALYRLSLQDIGFLKGLPLTHLGLGGNRIRDLTALSELKELQALDISDNPVSDLTALSNCPSLRALDISFTGAFSLSQLSGLELQTLELYDMPGGIDDSALRQIDGLNVLGADAPR